MAELADALDLGSSASGREGSSPFIRIFNNSPVCKNLIFITFLIVEQGSHLGIFSWYHYFQ